MDTATSSVERAAQAGAVTSSQQRDAPAAPPDPTGTLLDAWAAARGRHGERVDKYLTYLGRTDPLAEAVVAAFAGLPAGRGRRLLEQALDHGIAAVPEAPQALVDLFAQLDEVPFWVDWNQLDRGGQVFLRAGGLGALVLAAYSLPLTYRSPSGNKPLVFSGNLVRRAPRRLAETAGFVVATSRPGALRRYSEAFKITVKVRLMHAQVRQLIWRSNRWRADQWGAPINQAYMAATNLALSMIVLDGFRRLGYRISYRECEEVLALWRYSGRLSGVADELLCATESEAWRLVDLVFTSERAPDADSQALIHALISVPLLPSLARTRWINDAYSGIARSFIGDQLADALGYPKTAWRLALPVARPFLYVWHALLRSVPGADDRLATAGVRTWDWILEQQLAGGRAEFRLPEQLDSAATRPRPRCAGA